MSVARLDNRLHGDKIDRANALKGGFTTVAPNPQRIKPCKCPNADTCTHGKEAMYKPQSLREKIRLDINNYDQTHVRIGITHDPVTGLRYPTGFEDLCPRCGLQDCICGKNPPKNHDLVGVEFEEWNLKRLHHETVERAGELLEEIS